MPVSPPSSDRASARAALLVIAGGVAAALHVGKLPPAIAELQRTLGLTLVEAGFLLSLVQVAGMLAGAAFGALADRIGLKRGMVAGLVVLALASAVGGFARGATALLVLRAVEGLGFLLVVLPAPALLRRLVAPEKLARVLGFWGAYMPFGTAVALLAGPLVIQAWGWPVWWWLLAALAAIGAGAVARGVPADPAPGSTARPAPWAERFRVTLAAPGPWLVALTFAAYSSQWLAVIGFLPAIYLAAGVSGSATGVLTALAAAANIVGNVAAGRLLQRAVSPVRLLAVGFTVMALAAFVAFAGAGEGGAPPALRYAAVLVLSSVGGMIPATLFTLAVQVAPAESAVSTSVGWTQQWSAFGQFAGPPVVAWIASRAGGWHWTWLATGAWALCGLLLALALGRLLARAVREARGGAALSPRAPAARSSSTRPPRR